MAEIFTSGAMASAVALGDVAANFTALAILGASNKQLNLPLVGVKSGDVLSARPLAAIPDGYDVGAAFCTADGTLTVIIAHPALVINSNFNIPLRIFRITT